MKLSQRIGQQLISGKWRPALRVLCRRAGYSDIPYGMFGTSALWTLFVALAWYAYLVYMTSMFSTYGIVFTVASFFLLYPVFVLVLVVIAIYWVKIYLEIKAFNRVQSIELNLPMFLREFSTNLKAGREFVDALADSQTPELGPLNDDIERMVVEIRGGRMASHVLKEYSQRYDSYAINETFEIILDSYNGGGGLSEIIERIAENLEIIQYLRKNAIASVSNYIIFTTIVSLIIAPVLFALSENLLHLVQQLLGRVVESGWNADLPGNIRSPDIDFTDFAIFAHLAVAVIAGSAATIIGYIRQGRLKGALVMILIFIAVSLIVYNLSLWLFGYLFTALYKI
jgi:archaellum biogenesis protein FlaJ (TadC family)